MKNTLKIIFLGVIGFSLLVYFTAEKPKIIDKKNIENKSLNISNLPKNILLSGSEKIYNIESVIKRNSLLIIGNHDSISVVNEVEKHLNLDMPIVLVANISKAPWFIKKWVISDKLEELTKISKLPIVFDENGEFVFNLGLDDSAKTSFNVYKVDEIGNIKHIYKGNVKEGAIDGTMSDEEKKSVLNAILSRI